ncbi:Methylglutaconyl-CoA hydratase, mitochondrial [Hondaea fermentalgiana]|uniref:Methylglutaconyl-CoA hydratase, mitochondrial n=1 Tax=Hondaea fermentalgiana TaxID=2315210 RepID=A0A2R5G8B3_9STRA|nr:Methylglutaconyl-CoA hydratase, mitochondrial [Hondaea fermentalgiana]|eukprot:GBG26559.1 Methylglutaconyl-CoA hydratase, mitochondrial [Hondaea fermentalgiana]
MPRVAPRLHHVRCLSQAAPTTVVTSKAATSELKVELYEEGKLAKAESTLCLPETALGIFPGAMGTVLLPRIVGPAVARDLILTSRRFDGQEAFELGLANRVAKGAEQTVQTAMDLGAHISKMGPLGVKAARIVIDQGLDMSFKDHALLSDEHRFPLNDSEDFKEALAAFAEGRKPVFKGC